MEYAKINVLIVTYKQADVIGRNLESILMQKEYGLNKIIICDDCSPDNNWEVIQRYVTKYPDIIVAYRNNPNLGIYGNSNKLVTLCGDADLYCWLEGDDALCDGFLKSTQEFIKINSIDIKQPICIFGNYIAINTKGKRSLKKNDFVLKGFKPFGAYLRSLASWRGSVFSKKILDQFKPVETKKGLILAETLFDSQFFKYLDAAYYNPIPGSIYYSGIGVSITWGLIKNNSSYLTSDSIFMWQYLVENKYITDEMDLSWAKSKISYAHCLETFSMKEYFSYFLNYIKGMNTYQFNLLRFLLQAAHLVLISITNTLRKKITIQQ